MRLHINSSSLLTLLEHSRNARERSPTLEQLFDGRFRKDGRDIDMHTAKISEWPGIHDIDLEKIKPGLWLVGDRGIYFMSNGRPPLKDISEPGKNRVVHAIEADPAIHPDTWHDVKRAAFGADDGAVFIQESFCSKLIESSVADFCAIDLTPQHLAIVPPSPVLPGMSPPRRKVRAG